MSNQIKSFMAQKQKLKSERGSLNVGIKDMFMTIPTKSFRKIMEDLACLRDTSKSDFNLLLEMFEKFKGKRPETKKIEDVVKRHFIRRNAALNVLLCMLLNIYWQSQDLYDGGFFWRIMPTMKENENKAQFDIRRKRMEDNLMQVMLDVLDDCNYYIKGTQNSQKPQK